MGTTLTGTTPQDTYDSLIKVTDNGPIGPTAKFLSDGLGNDSVLALSDTAVGIGTTSPPTIFGVEDTNANIAVINVIGTSPNYIFDVRDDGTSVFRVAGSGNVGIGTSAPTARLVVVSNDPSQVSIEASAGNVNSQINLKPSGTGIGFIKTETNVDFAFGTNNSEKVRILAGGGITFNGDTAAANALDDYEEGTWTMGVSFGGASAGVTFFVNTGTYTKVGRQVTVSGYIALTSKGSSTGAAKITGLPFSIASGLSNAAAPSLHFENISFTNQFQGFCDPTTTTIILNETTILGATTALTNADFSDTSGIILSLTYFV